tara:strand:+ start:2236 stop:2367 length:132 start_codon:yes stop_codon:yes gene_type:complete
MELKQAGVRKHYFQRSTAFSRGLINDKFPPLEGLTAAAGTCSN